jgi:hypothetical protein
MMQTETKTEGTTDGTGGTWVAVGPAGAVGSVHQDGEQFRVDLYGSSARSAVYPTLESAKRAVHASLGPNAERPEFHAH